MDDATVFDWFRRCILIAMLVVVGIFWFTRPEPSAAPPNSVAFGCYISPVAPKIQIDVNGFQIGQSEFVAIDFQIVRQKTGLVLDLSKPLSLSLRQGRFEFSIKKRGIGTFLSLFRNDGQQLYNSVDVAGLDGFSIIDAEGRAVNFTRTDILKCQK